MGNQGAAPTADSPELDAWLAAHPEVSRAITIRRFQPGDSPTTFMLERATLNLKALAELRSLLVRARDRLTGAAKEIEERVQMALPTVNAWYFDEVQSIMFVRQFTWVLREVQQSEIAYLSGLYCQLESHVQDLQYAVDFIWGRIPDGMIFRVDMSVLAAAAPVTPPDPNCVLLSELGKRMGMAIDRFPRVLWVQELRLFVAAIIENCCVDLDVCYFPMLHIEHSLSRFFFSNYHERRAEIDDHLLQITRIPSRDFADDLLMMCYREIPSPASMSLDEQSKALLLMYRCFFNRCYELNPSFFAPSERSLDFLRKVDIVGRLPADSPGFCLPWNLLPPDADRHLPIRDFFARMPKYADAARRLSTAIFECNPIDQLFQVHMSLLTIQRAASEFRRGEANAMLLSFDDLFALFFGVLTATQFSDLFYVKWMVDNFAPKPWLSPSFEYAQANLEALVMHVDRLDIRDRTV
jgi:hypothetical protein